MTEITKEQLLNELKELKLIAQLPKFYLNNYFIDLRNDVDKEILAKQMEQDEQDNEAKISQLNELWKEISLRIQSFENSCTSESYHDFDKHHLTNQIEAMLKQETVNLDEVRELIDDADFYLMQHLFQHKTCVYVNTKELLDESKRQLIDGKLIILNDDTIRRKAFEKR